MLETHSTNHISKRELQYGELEAERPAARGQWMNTAAILQLFSKNAHL